MDFGVETWGVSVLGEFYKNLGATKHRFFLRWRIEDMAYGILIEAGT